MDEDSKNTENSEDSKNTENSDQQLIEVRHQTMSSNSRLSTTSLTKLNGKNYQQWKFHIKRVIASRGLTEVVYQGASDVDKELEANELLAGTLEASIMSKVLTCDTSHQIWTKLQSIHEIKGDGNLETMLNHFHGIKMESNEDVFTYIGRVEHAATEIRSLGEPISDRQLRARVLGGLSAKFTGFHRACNATNEGEKSLDLLTRRLIQDEAEQASCFTKNAALLTRGSRRIPLSEYKKTVKCHSCGKIGHFAKECRSKPNEGPSERQKEGQRYHQDKFTKKQSRDDGRKRFESNVVMMTFAYTSTNLGSAWYVDSGATSHMTNNHSVLTNYQEFEHHQVIIVGNSERLMAVGQGSVRVTSTLNDGEHVEFTLAEVWYVPDLVGNLLSVRAASKKGFKAVFEEDSVEFSYNGKVYAAGVLSEELNLFTVNIKPTKGSALLLKSDRNLEDWHKVTGHVDQNQLLNMEQKQAVDGFHIVGPSNRIECESCPLGKAKHNSHPTSIRPRATSVGERVHVDLIGTITPTSIGHNRYLILFTDEFSNYRVVYSLTSKEDVHSKIEDFITLIEYETGNNLKALVSDCGTEFLNAKVKAILNIEHVTLLTSAPRTPQQNGSAERSNRTLIEATRTLLNSKKLPLKLWAEAASTAAYLLNRTTVKNCNKTPYELWTNRKPNLSHLREFGEEAHVIDESRKESKWSPKTKRALLVGYTHKANTYRMYVPEDHRVVVTCDVVFRKYPQNTHFSIDEDDSGNTPGNDCQVDFSRIKPYHLATSDKSSTSCAIPNIEHRPDNTSASPIDEINDKGDAVSLGSTDTNVDKDTDCLHEESNNDINNVSFESARSNSDNVADNGKATVHSSESQQEADNEDKTNSVSSRTRSQTKKTGITNAFFSHLALAYHEPSNYHEAINSDEGKFWMDAIKEEIHSLEQNETWTYADLPSGRKALTTRWIFKRKVLPGGDVDRYKARLVARGCHQKLGIDFEETFAPVARYETIRCLLAVCTIRKLEILQFDVSTAFLHGKLNEEIYLTCPEGVDCPQGKFLKLSKSIYGLKQAPKCWYDKLSQILAELGLRSSQNDPCLYRGKFQGNECFLVVYVDDMLIASPTKKILETFATEIGKQLTIRVISTNYFVGLEIDRTGDTIKINQKAFIGKLLQTYNMDDCRPAPTPMGDITRLMSCDDDDKETTAPYREAIGGLNYLACVCLHV